MTISKPENREALFPPFETIGESNWNGKLRALLDAFEVPRSQPASPVSIKEREQELGVDFPRPLVLFLTEFGAVSFGYIEFLWEKKMTLATELWCADKFQNIDLKDYLVVANAGGGHNQFVLSLSSGECYLARHDSSELQPCVRNVHDLLRIGCVDLYTGYYGWDDDELEEMRNSVMTELFDYVL